MLTSDLLMYEGDWRQKYRESKRALLFTGIELKMDRDVKQLSFYVFRDFAAK